MQSHLEMIVSMTREHFTGVNTKHFVTSFIVAFFWLNNVNKFWFHLTYSSLWNLNFLGWLYNAMGQIFRMIKVYVNLETIGKIEVKYHN